VTFADAAAQLDAGLRRELPGPHAQDWLSPIPRRQWPKEFNPARVRHAAGLLLLFPKGGNAKPAKPAEPRRSSSTDSGATIGAEQAEFPEPMNALRASRALRSPDQAHIVLTVRSDRVRHGGQISLPGGVVEPGESFEQAALREAHEEVALTLDPVRVLGVLTPLDIPVSGFRLHPIVGVMPARPLLTPADAEVAHILEVAIADLLDPATFTFTARERDGIRYRVPAFHVGGREIWGATAMVLAEFLALLGWQGPEKA
jgi:8-oxo-dGTP pyrophosphatase MutT (NUDIX family)